MTQNLIKELERTLAALRSYEWSFKVLNGQAPIQVGEHTIQPSLDHNPTHASAMRASMDATKRLAAWRRLKANRYTVK